MTPQEVFVGLLIIHITTIIAFVKKLPDRWLILKLNIIFAPLGWYVFFKNLNGETSYDKHDKDNFICESCNKTFDSPKKVNKLVKVCFLLLIYGFILLVIDNIPTDDVSNILPRFILEITFLIIAIVHILTTLFKDVGRGKCPFCMSEDFVLIDSIKGQNLLKQIQKNKKSQLLKGSK